MVYIKRLLIFGPGGHGKVVLDCALSLKKYDHISFMVTDSSIKSFLDYPLIYEQETSVAHILDNFDELIVAIGNNSIRLEKSKYYQNNGVTLATLIHPSAVVSDFAKIGAGTVVFANAVVNPFAEVGSACIVNTGAVVEHDCKLSESVHLSPKVAIGGNVSIGEKSWLCIGSNIANNINIGANSVIGAGAVVLHDVPNNVLAAGVPAKILKEYK